MNYEKLPHEGKTIYVDDCSCEDIFDAALQDETEYGVRCNIDRCRIGMTYVLMQRWEELYSAEKSLQRGTVFHCLDLPFVGGGGR